MGSRAGSYNLAVEYGQTEDGYLANDAYWILAVFRLGMPLSFSRATMSSVTRDVTQGALLRADPPLVITDDCVSLSINASKRDHLSHLNASLIQTDTNYLTETLPGDHLFAWIVHTKEDSDRLLDQISRSKPCNDFNDGLKFVGRLHAIDKELSVSPDGNKTSSYSIQAIGFSELDSAFFYDHSLASSDQIGRDLGQWLARLGLHVQDLFASAADTSIPPNNVNVLIPTLLDLIVGKGPPAGKAASPLVPGAAGPAAPEGLSATPQTLSEPPYAYLVPSAVGALLGKGPSDASKPSKIMAYADLLELVQGVQHYSNKTNGTYQVFTPDLASGSPQRRVTTTAMLGTFLPLFPDLTNKPLWQVFQQFLNSAVNEMYTALRVNPEGKVVPTIVLRQIPFTTEAFEPDTTVAGPQDGGTHPTRFLDLPRWLIPTTAIRHVKIGRSDATRTNFVHVYGSSSMMQNATPVQYQLVANPPLRDDLDIQRSGMRPYMSTVECWVSDTVGKAPGKWMRLIADWMIGSQYTLNGSLSCTGIQSPICPGDNFEFDGVVYHIESVAHQCGIDAAGNKSWNTNLTFTNGMRAEGSTDVATGANDEKQPIYPGFTRFDNTTYDPGITVERGGEGAGPETAAAPQLNPTGEVIDWANPDDGGYMKSRRW